MTDIRVSSFCPNANCVTVEFDEHDPEVCVWQSADPDRRVAFTHDEWSAFVAGVKAGEFDTPGDLGMSPLVFTYRNHRGETATRRVIPHSIRYGTAEHHPEPGWLLEAWDLDREAPRTFALAGVLDGPSEVLALPPEPEVGVTVEVVGGSRAGERWGRTSYEPPWRSGDGWTYWPSLLVLAGPSGVRVVPPAEAGEVSR